MNNKVIPINKNKSFEEIEKEISILRLGYDMDCPDSMINYCKQLTIDSFKSANISEPIDIPDHNILLGALRSYISKLEKDFKKYEEKNNDWEKRNK